MQMASLLSEGTARSFDQVRNDRRGIPTRNFRNSNQFEEEDGFWLKQVQSMILRKDEISRSPSFNRYSESWLLLWVKLASDEEELQRRSIPLAKSLSDFWHPDRFRKIIIQANYVRDFAILSAQGVEFLKGCQSRTCPEVFSMDDTLRLE